MSRLSPCAAIFALLLSSGCTTTGGNYTELEKAIERAQNTADEALRQARSAQIKANETLGPSSIRSNDSSTTDTSTRDIAKQALAEAQAAKKEAELATKRAERMFKMTQSR